MKLYYPITIDLYKVSPLQVMEAQQGNAGRGAIVTLTAGSAVIDPTDENVEVYAKKPDGTVSWLECSIEDGKIKIDFTNQMLMSPGVLQVELRLKNEADDITTPIFMVKVNKSNVQSAGRSENELPLLDQIKKDVAAAQDEISKLSEDIADLKENGTGSVSDEKIAEAVEKYMEENPVEGGGTGVDDVGIQSVEQTTTSTEDGGTNIITVTKTDGTSSTFQVLNGSKGSDGYTPQKGIDYFDGEDGKDGADGLNGVDGKTAYQYAQDGGYTKTEEEFAQKLAEENPTKEEFEKLSEDKVSNPNTGEVGQILEIESVDENGKPKTYKAVNKPTGDEVSDEQIIEVVENYLTENPIKVDLSDYAKKNELPTVPTKVSAFENDKGYLTEHQSLEGYAKTSDIPTDYAKENHTHSEYLTEHQDISGKQDKLVSGTNIKTINGNSLLGSGDIAIEGGSSGGSGEWETICEIDWSNETILATQNFEYTGKWNRLHIISDQLVGGIASNYHINLYDEVSKNVMYLTFMSVCSYVANGNAGKRYHAWVEADGNSFQYLQPQSEFNSDRSGTAIVSNSTSLTTGVISKVTISKRDIVDNQPKSGTTTIYGRKVA